MATMYWQGQATAVAQVTTVTVGGTLSGETFTISVGGVAIATHTDATTTIANTVAGLVAAWNASTHPYATGITAADDSPDVVLTADTAGIPFVITLNTPGGSATLGQAATTANAGPNVWAAANFWNGTAYALPANSDTVVIENNDVDVLWGLAQSAVTLTELRIMHSYTGKIGLPDDELTTSATATVTTKPEYRDTSLAISATTLRIGEHYGSGSPAGSGRIKIDTGSNQTTLIVSNSSASSTDGNLEPIRWKGTHASNAVQLLKGRLGIATSYAGEAATVSELNVAHRGNVAGDADVNVGAGVTLTTVNQSGGDAVVQCAFTTLEQTAGESTTIGAGAVTTANVGGTLYARSTGTITTLRVTGKADFSRDPRDRTVTNCELHKGGSLMLDNGNPISVTLTNGIDLIRCGLEDVTIKAGSHYTVPALTAV